MLDLKSIIGPSSCGMDKRLPGLRSTAGIGAADARPTPYRCPGRAERSCERRLRSDRECGERRVARGEASDSVLRLSGLECMVRDSQWSACALRWNEDRIVAASLLPWFAW